MLADDGEPSCDGIELTRFLVPLCRDEVLLTILANVTNSLRK
jgi:hypothetical protein